MSPALGYGVDLIQPSGGGGGGGSSMPNSTNDFRLTLASGFAVYSPQPAIPASTDTTNNLVTMSVDPGWVTGTVVTPLATAGGLTNGTIYWLGRLSATTFAFYTSLANAQSDTSRVVLSAAIGQINPSGVQNTTLYLSPYRGNQIGLFDGVSTWNFISSAEVSIALGTLTSGLPYDVFAFNNSGVVTLELLAWTNVTTRATALIQQNGIWVKSGATARRYLGTFYTISTTATADDGGHLGSQVGGQRFLWNAVNRVRVKLSVHDATANWTYASATVRQANGAAGNKVELVLGLSEDDITAEIITTIKSPGFATSSAIGIDSTTAYRFDGLYPQINTDGAGAVIMAQASRWNGRLSVGYHSITWLEAVPGAGTATFFGDNGNLAHPGLVAAMMA